MTPPQLTVQLPLDATSFEPVLINLSQILKALHLSHTLPHQEPPAKSEIIFVAKSCATHQDPNIEILSRDKNSETYPTWAIRCRNSEPEITVKPHKGIRQQALEIASIIQKMMKQKAPLCTVVIPSYNYGKYICTAINSVLQSLPEEFEILVLDNASTDNTKQLLDQYRNIHNLKIIENEINLGPVQNWINGYHLSISDYIHFLCADDYVANHFLPSVERTIRTFHPDVIFTALNYIDETGIKETVSSHPGYPKSDGLTGRNELLTLLTKDCYCPPSSTVYRKSSLEKIGGFDTGLAGAGDWDTAVQLALAGGRFFFISEPGVFYRLHQNQHTHSWGNSTAPLEDHCRILERVLKNGLPVQLQDHEQAVAQLLVRRASAYPQIPAQLSSRLNDVLSRLGHPPITSNESAVEPPPPNPSTEPQFSVILTTFNRPRLFVDAMRSVDNQTYRNFEVVVVNDCGSPVEHLVDQFRSVIHVIRHGVNRGLSAARNTGLSFARGQYIVYLDDDDLMLPEHLEVLASGIALNPEAVHYTDADYVSEKLELNKRIELSRDNPLRHFEYSADLLQIKNYIPVNTFCHPRSAVATTGGFDETLPALEDWDFLLRLSRTLPFSHIHRTTVEVRTLRESGENHMSARVREDFPDLYRRIYSKYPSPDRAVLAGRAQLLVSLESDRARRKADRPLSEREANHADVETESERNRRYYLQWLIKTSFTEIDAQLLAERMMLKWSKRPGIHLFMSLHSGDELLLADTLDSLEIQLYPDWFLSVVTDLPKPEGVDDVQRIQWLSLQDSAHIDYVIDELAAASPGTWLARIAPGLTFSPQTFQIFADYINARPMWHCIYCDEDIREHDGSYAEPRFKPDINLDLLRAQNYLGSFVMVEKEAFLVVGRYGSNRGAENYDLCLRILDQAGPQSIGHIDQVLAHLPRISTQITASEAERRSVEDHLARLGITAKVEDGIAPGTRRVECNWPDKPLVSIVIQTRDREEYLRPLLDSLYETTSYSEYEVVIVDNETKDPDALEWLNDLQKDPRWSRRLSVLTLGGQFNWAGAANAGASASHGSYLLFLDNDIHVVQQKWLERMMTIAQRPEVGIVGPRLVFAETAKIQESGWILGVQGLAASPWNTEMELAEPGYMGRAVCDQNVKAVSGSALLVRTSVFTECNGFDEESFPLFNGALDLCLRVSERGLKIVSTPYSTLVHYGAVSMRERRKDTASALEDVIAAKSERDKILTRWLPTLSNDPGYNKNLSLMEPYRPEPFVPVVWDTNFHDRSRILGIPLTGGAGEYRLRAPLRTIARAGLAQTAICEPPAHLSVRILSPIEIARIAPDSLVFHQPIDDHQTETLQSLAKLMPSIRRIITIDDLFTAVPRKNAFHNFGPKDSRPRLRRSLGLAERLIVSTQPLADFCSNMIDDIRVMPNCLEKEIWEGAQPPLRQRKKPRVGWAGAQQHLGDLELIYPVVEALSNEVDWVFMGMCPDPLRPFVREFHRFVRDFEAYPAALAQLDLNLAIAPLELNAFNEAKSNLRLLEYGFMGWPVICTDIFPYQDAPVTRLPNEPQRWISAIREHLAEPVAMQAAGKALQDWVLANFILEDHATDWLDAYGP